MGIQHGGDGGSDLPPEGDLPELPPDWGAVPDDPAELAAEAEAVRAELAREQAGEEPIPASPGANAPSVGTPLLIMSVAVVITLVSLFAMTWSGSGAMTDDPTRPTDRTAAADPLGRITLADPTGRQVTLATQMPMVMMLVEECDCEQLIAATAAAAPAGVRVVLVGHTAPPAPSNLGPGDQVPVRLADPAGQVRSQLELAPPTDTPTVLVVGGDGELRQTVPSATSVAQYQAELTNLS